MTTEKDTNMTKVSNSASTRLPKIHLDKTLVGRLEALAASVMRRSPEVGERLIDEIAERDAGSYILDEMGNLLPGAELKIRALESWGAEIEIRSLLTETVFRHGLVEPVILPGDLATKFDLPDFFTVLPTPEDGTIFGAMPRENWLLVARFLAAQRLSLYTMARLIALAGETA